MKLPDNLEVDFAGKVYSLLGIVLLLVLEPKGELTLQLPKYYFSTPYKNPW